MKKTKRTILTVVIALFLGAGAYFKYHISYIRIGRVFETKSEQLKLNSMGQNPLTYVFNIEPISEFYDIDGKKIGIEKILPGQRVKIKLLPRSYGSTIRVRNKEAIRWLKILGHD